MALNILRTGPYPQINATDQDIFSFIKLLAVLVVEIILVREPMEFGILDSLRRLVLMDVSRSG